MVVDTGSFSAAATALNRSQSTISYAMARLRDAIGVDLLRLEGRRAVLTPEGASLLADITPLIEDFRRVERRGAAALRGERLQIRLLFDTLFPRERLLNAIEAFAADWPHISIDLHETVRQPVETVTWTHYDLAILVAAPGAASAEIIARVDHMTALEQNVIRCLGRGGYRQRQTDYYSQTLHIRCISKPPQCTSDRSAAGKTRGYFPGPLAKVYQHARSNPT